MLVSSASSKVSFQRLAAYLPDLAIWAHQARQISGQALEAHVSRGQRNQRSSHLFCRILALANLVMFFRKHSAAGHRTYWPLPISIFTADKTSVRVEAQNFVPYIWAPGAEGASGATGYARDHCDPWRPVFCCGKGRARGKRR